MRWCLCALLLLLSSWTTTAFAQTLLTDFNTYTEPSLPTMGAAGSKIVDPTFGTTILRVTDGNDGAFGRALYSTYPSVNVNSTRVMGNVSSGGQTKAKFWTLDATNFTVANGTVPSGRPNMEKFFAVCSCVSADIIYGGGGSCTCLWTYNVSTNVGSKLVELSGFGGAELNQISMSKDDNIFYGSLSSGGYVVWRRSDSTVLASSATGTEDEGYIDKTGEYFYWTNTSCGNEVRALPGNTLIATLSGNDGLCHNDRGTRTVVNDRPSASSIATRSLATPSTITNHMATYFQQNTQSQHLSWNQNDESYALISRHNAYNGTGNVVGAFDNELVLVAASGDAVKRIAHHRSRTATADGTTYGYYDTPFANISPDGQFVAFTSNWGGTTGNNRQDLYLVKIPVAAPGSLTISGPITISGGVRIQ